MLRALALTYPDTMMIFNFRGRLPAKYSKVVSGSAIGVIIIIIISLSSDTRSIVNTYYIKDLLLCFYFSLILIQTLGVFNNMVNMIKMLKAN